MLRGRRTRSASPTFAGSAVEWSVLVDVCRPSDPRARSVGSIEPRGAGPRDPSPVRAGRPRCCLGACDDRGRRCGSEPCRVASAASGAGVALASASEIAAREALTRARRSRQSLATPITTDRRHLASQSSSSEELEFLSSDGRSVGDGSRRLELQARAPRGPYRFLGAFPPRLLRTRPVNSPSRSSTKRP